MWPANSAVPQERCKAPGQQQQESMRGAVARPRPIEALGYYANSIVVCMFIRKLHDFLNIEQEQFAVLSAKPIQKQ